MKIAEVPHVFLPNIGGIEFYVYRLARDLMKKGEDVEILTSDMSFSTRKALVPDPGMKVRYFSAFVVIFRNPLTPWLFFHMLRNRYDLIHAHSIQAFPAIIAVLCRKKAKLVITAHGVSPDTHSFLLNLVWKIYMPVAGYMCRRSDSIIVLTQKEKDKLVRLFRLEPGKIRVIPNGIDAPPMPSDTVIESFKILHGLGDKKTILYSGRVTSIKNVDTLIRAFALAARDFNGLNLLLVGPVDEDYKKSMETLAEKLNIRRLVVFTGEVTRDELLAAYHISDVFVSLGAWEGMPTTMLEAMYLEKPCIMLDAGGVGDIIRDGYDGYLVKSLDPASISDKIKALLLDPEIGRCIGERAKRKVAENYTWERTFDAIYSLYKEL